VHGANRLASNSLLEGLVFGARAGRVAARDHAGSNVSVPANVDADVMESNELSADGSQVGPRRREEVALAVRKRVRRLMWERVGLLRRREGLERALAEFDQISRASLSLASRNFLTVATLIARSALWREESRGAHFRLDYPRTDDEHWRVHSIIRNGQKITSSPKIEGESVEVGGRN
jgi:aspartate oxidase